MGHGFRVNHAIATFVGLSIVLACITLLSFDGQHIRKIRTQSETFESTNLPQEVLSSGLSVLHAITEARGTMQKSLHDALDDRSLRPPPPVIYSAKHTLLSSSRDGEVALIGPPEISNETSRSSSASQRQPLSAILNETTHQIVGDPQPLLDFAIIGFGKCGTSTLMSWLGQHPEIQCIQQEVWALINNKPHTLIRRLYHELPDGQFKRGYKCPADINGGENVMRLFRTYWPKTKLIIGIRHPLDWFQSLYNFRIQNLNNGLPHPNELIGKCHKESKFTCTEMAHFAGKLLRLGKQNLPIPRPPTPLENILLRRKKRGGVFFNVSSVEPIPNEVFLFDVAQLSDQNATRLEQFKRDLQAFLGLSAPMPAMPHYRPGKVIHNATIQASKDAQKIQDLCAAEYRPLREELLQIAQHNGAWIRDSFLGAPGVHVSNPEYFHQLMTSWVEENPCDKQTKRKKQR